MEISEILDIDNNVKEALDELGKGKGPYIHSKTFEEFQHLRKVLESLGFRGAGNVDIRYDPLYRRIYKGGGYDIIRTLGFDGNGIAMQYHNSPGEECVFFFIREAENKQKNI